ncbi:MAG: hypothetical protein ACOY33_13085 [Pseudomonadota bacterium]
MLVQRLRAATLALCLCAPATQAATLTGADILAQGTFPTGGVTLNGTSLVVGPASGQYAYQKMISLPVSSFLDGNTLDLRLDMTRLACAFGCGDDSNPIFAISDGVNAIVLAPGEDFNGALGAGAMPDLGTHAGSFYYATTLGFNVGYPPVGGTYSFTVHYEFNATSTYTEGTMNTTTISYLHPIALDTNNLSLVLFHDNDYGEQYQIDVVDAPNAPATDVPVAVDIKPGSCPNALGLAKNGVLPVAVNGTAAFAATGIDPASVRLAGVAPLRHAFADVATPHEPVTGKQGRHDCTAAGGDGIVDLTLKFDAQQILDAIAPVAVDDEVTLPLTGTLFDGTPITGEDIVWIRP